MYLNGCSKKMCPLQVGKADNCNLTKEQCPYFTQNIDYHRVMKQIEVEVAKGIFDEIEKLVSTNKKTVACATYEETIFYIEDFIEDLAELKKKYTGEKEDEQIH